MIPLAHEVLGLNWVCDVCADLDYDGDFLAYIFSFSPAIPLLHQALGLNWACDACVVVDYDDDFLTYVEGEDCSCDLFVKCEVDCVHAFSIFLGFCSLISEAAFH